MFEFFLDDTMDFICEDSNDDDGIEEDDSSPDLGETELNSRAFVNIF